MVELMDESGSVLLDGVGENIVDGLLEPVMRMLSPDHPDHPGPSPRAPDDIE